MKLTGSGVLSLVAVAGVGFIGYKLMNMNLDPRDGENVINKAVTGAVGENNIATAADYYFGAIDLVNPLNESDYYAREVYGINNIGRWLGFEVTP